jgi:CDP-diglyceride synthetase
MTLEIFVYSILLFVALFAVGTLLCLKLYKWEYARFFHSMLWTKVYYWIPIFLVFLLMLYVQLWAAVAIVCAIVGFAAHELLRQSRKDWTALLYTFIIGIAAAHLILFFISFDGQKSTNVLLVVGFSSVLSDIFAYFLGNFLGRYRLPSWINNKKSWDGVVGQLIGAVVGFLLISPVISPRLHIALAILIGIASAIGDVLNSIVKRRIGIKDWGMTIPGHGGVLDRFASLSFAIATAYWWTTLIK